ERDYQELKSELGLHHYEGRNWRGFHHHASLCIAAYGFLMRERLRSKKNSVAFKMPA
ncbi:IS701 family transposase, partial [Xanthomonas oryzae pv. oryzae]